MQALTEDEIAVLRRLTGLGYLENFDSSEQAIIEKMRSIGMLDDSLSLPALATSELGSRVVFYASALKIREGRSKRDIIRCHVKGHSWWSGQEPWKLPLGSTPMAGYCRRCGVYTEYISDRYDYLNGEVPRDENGRTIHIDYVESEWRWK